MNISQKTKVTIWTISIILLISPAFLDSFLGENIEIVWMIQLISIYLISFNFSYLSIGLIGLLSVIIHLCYEIAEYIEQSTFHLHDSQMLIGLTIIKTVYTIGKIRQVNNTEKKQFELEKLNKKLAEKSQELQHMAFYDALTGLPNRYMLSEYLNNELVQCRDKEQQLAVLFLDLDKFKSINDALGHDVGDLLLQQVSERLLSIIKKEGFVARHGGDEFIVILESTSKEHVVKMTNLILFRFIAPFMLNKKKYFITPSIGISRYPNDAKDGETLIKYADMAMYAAKENLSNNYSFYTIAREEAINRKLQLQNDLRLASWNKDLQIYYQPKVNLKTGEITGLEALLRWNHPEFGFVSPAEFIPLSEESGLIIPIGKWVLKNVCEQARKWKDLGLPPISVAVNVSIQQFNDEHFTENIKEILLETELNPGLLEIEITESIMQNIKKVLPIIKELKKLGIKTSIDDFGTGYSSLSVLSQLPIDYLKIDQSFVKDALSNSSTSAIIKTIIQLGHNLKFDLIAEGIETEQQADFLLRYGCQIGQGYLFSKPLPSNEIQELLKVGCTPIK